MKNKEKQRQVCTPQVAPRKAVWAIRYKYQVELTPNTTSAQQETLHESKYKDTLTRNKKLEDKEDQDEQGCINSQPENESSERRRRAKSTSSRCKS